MDYLYAGGSGEPPLLPPKKYQSFRYENPQGAQAIRDWFAGFRRGAAAAAASGYRNYVVVPSTTTGRRSRQHGVPHAASKSLPGPITRPSDVTPLFPPFPRRTERRRPKSSDARNSRDAPTTDRFFGLRGDCRRCPPQTQAEPLVLPPAGGGATATGDAAASASDDAPPKSLRPSPKKSSHLRRHTHCRNP